MNKNLIIKYFLVMVIMITAPVLCQTDSSKISVKDLVIGGNHLISQKDIRQILPPGDYSLKSLETAIHRILKIYQQKGYPFSQIDVSHSKTILKVDINEGRKLVLDHISLNCPDSLLLFKLKQEMDLREKTKANETLIFNINSLLNYLENHGYPFAKVIIDSLRFKQDKIQPQVLLECFLSVQPAEQITLDEFRVFGNDITKTKVILREMRLKKGMIYNHQQILRGIRQLKKTGYFEKIEPPQIAIDEKGRGHLLIRVKEGTAYQLNAVFGYNPAQTKNEKGYFTGLIDVGFTNLFGTGRILETYWQKKDQRSQELRFRYVEPWVGGYPVNVGFGFQQTIQDTSFVRRNWGLDVEIPFSYILTIHSHVGREHVLPDSIGEILYNLPKSSFWLYKIGFSYDTRDNPWNSSRGIFYSTQYEYASKKITSVADTISSPPVTKGSFYRERWTIDAELYLPTFKWQTILLGLHGRQVKSDEETISFADLYRLGGTGSLRGYREDQFLGQKVAWANIEYRYLLGPFSRAFLFIDGGYFMKHNENNELQQDYKIGYGFGLRINTRLGIIGIDYGLGENRSLSSGMIHVGLMNKF